MNVKREITTFSFESNKMHKSRVALTQTLHPTPSRSRTSNRNEARMRWTWFSQHVERFCFFVAKILRWEWDGLGENTRPKKDGQKKKNTSRNSDNELFIPRPLSPVKVSKKDCVKWRYGTRISSYSTFRRTTTGGNSRERRDNIPAYTKLDRVSACAGEQSWFFPNYRCS